MHTRIKICGITRPEDAEVAVAAGADALGFVFYGPSPRCVGRTTARAIVRALPPFVAAVGLFVDASLEEISAVLKDVPLSVLQFHGQEAPFECERFGLPYVKAVRMSEDVDLVDVQRQYESAQALLLDSYEKGRPGGTGRVFDWTRVSPSLQKPLILAGGLHADNVAAAIAQVRPYAVDVSGGVESAPGIKDGLRVHRFCRRVRGEE